MKKSKDILNIILNIVLLLVFSSFFLLTTNEWILTGIIIVLILVTLKMGYHKREWILPLVGILAGILLEFGGDLIYKLQYWSSGSFFGIPLWLPLFWGYAFLLINRAGRIIVK
jgi:general stress protein CsbA